MGTRADLQFLATGLLSTTPLAHQVTLEELREYFVERFPGSETRARLFDNFVHYLKLLAVFVELRGVLVNGSFVTSKLDPRDIDISPVIDGVAFDKLPKEQQEAVECLIDHNSQLPRLLSCHPLYVPFIYPESGGRFRRDTTFMDGVRFWSRAKGGQRKGLLFLWLKREDLR